MIFLQQLHLVGAKNTVRRSDQTPSLRLRRKLGCACGATVRRLRRRRWAPAAPLLPTLHPGLPARIQVRNFKCGIVAGRRFKCGIVEFRT